MIIRTIVNTALLLTLTAMTVVVGPQVHRSFLRRYVGARVVRITNFERNSGGTGSLVTAPSGKTFILTNRHICDSGAEFPRGLWVNGKHLHPLKVSATDDLCLIAVPKGLGLPETGLNVRDEGPFVGEIIHALGHPQLIPQTLTTGEFVAPLIVSVIVGFARQCTPDERVGADMFGTLYCSKTYNAVATTIPILPGNSGSPMVDSLGNLVGVMFASDASMRGAAVSLEGVKRFLKGM